MEDCTSAVGVAVLAVGGGDIVLPVMVCLQVLLNDEALSTDADGYRPLGLLSKPFFFWSYTFFFFFA